MSTGIVLALAALAFAAGMLGGALGTWLAARRAAQEEPEPMVTPDPDLSHLPESVRARMRGRSLESRFHMRNGGG